MLYFNLKSWQYGLNLIMYFFKLDMQSDSLAKFTVRRSLREGNVFSHVCLSISSRRDPHVIGHMGPHPLPHWNSPVPTLALPSDEFTWEPPRRVGKCWFSTERPSFLLSICSRLLVFTVRCVKEYIFLFQSSKKWNVLACIIIPIRALFVLLHCLLFPTDRSYAALFDNDKKRCRY